jgi:DNA-binding NarL/FixJ family response regulator
LADQYWVDARTGDSLEAAALAASALGRLNRPAMLAEAMLSRARFSVTIGDVLQARAQLDAAATLVSHFDMALRTSFYEVRAETHAAYGNAAAALDDCAIASSLAAEAADSETIAQIENNYALVAADLGELDLAAARHEIALSEARRTSMLWRVAYSALNYANTLMLRGELERARRLVWEAIESGVTTATFKTKAASVGIPLALLLNDRGLLEACADESALVHAARSQEVQRIANVAAAFAELRRAQGAYVEARALLAQATSAIAQPHRCLGFFLQIAAIGDDRDRAWARAMLSRSNTRPRVKRACRLLFEAATAGDSNSPRTQRMARLAAAAFGRMGWRLWEARALETAGRRDEALRRYAEMGDVRDLERLRGRETSGAETIALSPRQMEVARLVADGQTNRSIAQSLHISEHTVEHHLSTIFSRLGLRSRSALAGKIGRLRTGP